MLVAVDRSALPPEQEHERGYTVRLPDGSERNTLASRLRLPLEPGSGRPQLEEERGGAVALLR
eukprot:COSAG01_NODE_29468_length_636_cov_22.785847_2_plen_63_part_00